MTEITRKEQPARGLRFAIERGEIARAYLYMMSNARQRARRRSGRGRTASEVL